MRNAGMEEAQAVIKIAGRNINNLRYADQFSSVTNPVWLLATPWTTAQEASLSMTNSRSSPKPMSIKSVMPSNHLILCCPFLLLLSIFPSIRVFSNESALRIRWPKYWVSASTSVLPMNTQDWSPLGCKDLLAVQGTFKSLFQHHSSKASIFWHSDFFIVQLSHPYMTTGKTIALTIWIFLAKWCLYFLICCLHLSWLSFQGTGVLISWLQSLSAVILEPPQNKICHCFHIFSFYLPWSDGTRFHDLSFLNVEF